MKIHRQDIEVGWHSEITIRHKTDTHHFSEGHHSRLFKKFVNIQSKDKDSWWVDGGDLLDADRPSLRDRKKIMYSDRKEAWTQDDKQSMALIDKEIIPLYLPIKDRCLGMIDGDHYAIYSNGMTSTEYIARKLGVPYLGERMAFIGLVFKNPGGQKCRYTILLLSLIHI